MLCMLMIASALQACGSQVPTPENSAWSGLADALTSARSDPTQNVALSQLGWYLKVQLPDSPPAILAFGYLDQQTTPPTEVWFSGAEQYVKLRAGHLVTTHGLPGVNWHNAVTDSPLPDWSQITTSGHAFQRVRSTMPHYDVGIREQLRIVRSKAPPQPVATLMPGATDEKARHWQWFSETVVSSNRQPLPDALYATAHIRGVTVVAYYRQCLTADYCLSMMRWPQLESEPHPW